MHVCLLCLTKCEIRSVIIIILIVVSPLTEITASEHRKDIITNR